MNEIIIQVFANRKLSKKTVDIGNMQENKVTKLIFELDEGIAALGGNVYLFVSYDGESYPYPLSDGVFEVGRELTQRKKTEANIVVSTSDDPENLLEHAVWISNTLMLMVDKNSINIDAINEVKLPPSLQIVYDRLFALEKDLQEKKDIDYWRGPKGDKGDKGDKGEQGDAGVDEETFLKLAIKPTTEQAEHLHITDSADYRILDFTLKGKTEQNTVAGNQRVNIIDRDPFERQGLMWSCQGGSVTVKGTVTGHSYFIFADLRGLVGTFYVSGTGNYIGVSVNIKKSGSDTWIDTQGSFTLDGTEDKVDFYCQVYNNHVGVDINETIYPMVNKGTTALPFEPFTNGPSPNPSYPQEIVNAENVEVKFLAKNVWDKEYANDSNNWYINMHDSANKGYKEMPVFVGKGNEVTVSYAQTLELGLNLFVGIALETTEGIHYDHWMYHPNDGVCVRKSITLISTGDYIYIRFYNNLATFMQYIGNDFQIEYGSVATDCKSYKAEQAFTIPYVLRGVGDERDYVDFGEKKLVRSIGEYTFTGDETLSNFTGIITAPLLHKSNSDFMCSHGVQGDDIKWANDRYIAFSKTFLGVDTNEEFEALLREKYEAGEPLKVVYALAEPIITDLTDEEVAQYEAIMTHYPTTNVINNLGCPMQLQYVADTKNYIDNQLLEIKKAMI